MKAKEMFEKLGWKLDILDYDDYDLLLKYSKEREEYPNDMWLGFCVKKTWIYGAGIDYIEEVSVELHKAITQQMKELGWL